LAIILYGVAAGFAVAAVIVLGPIFLGLIASVIFKFFGWQEASQFAAVIGLYYINFTGVIGIVAGLIVGFMVCFRRLRNPESPPR